MATARTETKEIKTAAQEMNIGTIKTISDAMHFDDESKGIRRNAPSRKSSS